MQQKPTRNIMFKGPHGALSDGFVWWKRILKVTLILLPISSYILARTLSRSDGEIDYFSFWMTIYYTIFLTAFLLPMLAPKEIRHLVNDSYLSKKAMNKARLFTNGVFMDREADLILDEREKELRMKAYSFSFKATLLIGAIIFGISLSKSTHAVGDYYSVIAISTFLLMINLLPCSYIAKHHKPLPMFENENDVVATKPTSLPFANNETLGTIKKFTVLRTIGFPIAAICVGFAKAFPLLGLIALIAFIAAYYASHRLRFLIPSLFQKENLAASVETALYHRAKSIGYDSISMLVGIVVVALFLNDIYDLPLWLPSTIVQWLVVVGTLAGIHFSLPQLYTAFYFERFVEDNKAASNV